MTPRSRRRVETGFKSLRDLLICCVGVYGFWFQMTRVAEPDRFILAASVLLMVAPSTSAVYRIVNALLGPDERPQAPREDEE